MASQPIITFKAGQCEIEGKKVKPVPTHGYIYLYEEDDLLHFCWRKRDSPATEPEIDLIAFPGDCTFLPYTGTSSVSASSDTVSPTNGRIFVLRFSSSSQRHFFWMQAKSQHKEGNPSWFSARDKRLGDIIHQLLSGEEADVEEEVRGLQGGGSGGGDDDDDVMEDAPGSNQQPEHHRQGSGGAGADATGGDPRAEGEASRGGGADGGRAPTGDTNAAVQNFLRSLQGSGSSTSSSQQQPQQSQQSYDRPFTTLTELLNPSTTTSWLTTATPSQIDSLCAYLPPTLFLLAQESAATTTSAAEPSPAAANAAIEAMATEQKRDLLQRVLRSPQLHQSLGSLTYALRDGGLPMISEALGVQVQHGGTVRGGTVPLGGGEAVEAFLEGVKKGVQEKKT